MKRIFALIVIALCLSGAYAQETYVASNDNLLFQKGKTCFDERKFSVAIQFFQRYLDESADKNDALREKADYYIVSCRYALKDAKRIALLQDFLKVYPYSPMRNRVAFMIGCSYYDAANYEDAIKWYSQVKKSQLDDKESMEFAFTNGFSHLSLKNYNEARTIFAPLSAKTGKYEEDARYYYAYCDFCLKNFDEALMEFNAMSQKGKYVEPASYYVLQIYDQQGDHDKAVEYGKELIKKFPTSRHNSEAYRILGETSYRKGNYPEAVDNLKKYERNLKKVSRSTMYMLGVSYYETANYLNAINYLSKVTTENDSLSQNAYLHIGNSYIKINDVKNAKMAFQSAALGEFDKNVQEVAAFNYALAAYQSGALFGETISLFENFIANYPKSRYLNEIYTHMANAYIAEKNYAAAYASIKKIETTNPKIKAAKENALFQLGLAEHTKGQYTAALDYFSLAVKEYDAKSFSAQALLWRGDTYYRLGKYEECRKDLLKFIDAKQKKTSDDILKSYYTIAYSFFGQKKYKAALEWFLKCLEDKSVAASPLYADILNRTADCYFQERELEAARQYYAKVPTTEPAAADYAAFQGAFILGLQKKYTEKIKALEQLIANHPESDYADDALYEIGRAYVLQEKYELAIATYEKVLANYGKTTVARKAALETGMLYANLANTDKAITAYEQVVELYPNSEEARTAIESLQTLYVDKNDIEGYIAYVKRISKFAVAVLPETQEDSLSFVAAERLFIKANYKESAKAFQNYLNKYCKAQTLNCISAIYYLAESYYQTDQKTQALDEFEKLTQLDGNPYLTEALSRAAELAYADKQTADALNYFTQLYEKADNKHIKRDALFGMMRCYYLQNDNDKVITTADKIMDDNTSSATVVREARYCRAKAYIAKNETASAIDDLKKLSSDTHHEMGAEAKFLYANYLHLSGNYTSAQTEIFELIQSNTPHQYWLARSFVLLADTYIEQDDDFQAKQYLLSLQENYKAKNDVAQMIEQRLEAIAAREKEKVY